MKKLLSVISVLSVFMSVAANTGRQAWVSDQGDGTYVNPIINADYSDPDVIAVGDDFYMTASSFNCVPGLPVLHSKDLVNWEIIGHALEAVPPVDHYSAVRHGGGVWAPSLRWHDGRFYIFWGDPDFGIFMVSTDDPRQRWSEPVLVKAGKGMIDTTPLWDDDGRAYLVNGWAGSRALFNSVLSVWEMKPDGTGLIGNPVMVFDGNDGVNVTVEGPKFYKRDGWYYILAPAGGVAQGWQLAMRSRSPFGPYEVRRVMEQGDTDINGPHQGGLVDTPTGQSWFINFQDKDLYGRVLHLNPVTWRDGWPVIGDDSDGDGCGNPVRRWQKPDVGRSWPVVTPADSDGFDTTSLGLQWQWQANYSPEFGLTTPYGFMRVYGHSLDGQSVNLWEVPNMLLQKFPADEFTVTAKVKIAARAGLNRSGLIVMGQDYAAVGAEMRDGRFTIFRTTCIDAVKKRPETVVDIETVDPTRVLGTGKKITRELDLWLKVRVDKEGLCTFSYSLDGKRFTVAGDRFKAREGKWIGAKTGVFSVQPEGVNRGWIDVDSFEVSANDR